MTRTILAALIALVMAESAAGQTIVGDRVRLNAGPCVEQSGAGSPEGAVTGNVCDTWHQTDSPYDLWRKVSGTGNTGWQKIGTVTSVATTGPSLITWSGSPITSSGTLTASWGSATAGQIVRSTGSDAAWSTSTWPNTVTANQLCYATATNAVGCGSADLTYDGTTLVVGNSISTPTSTNLTLNPTGDLITNPTGNDILPTTNYDINIGALSTKYLALHAAELWVETLVAQDTLATIGGRILVAPTTLLSADLGTGGTTITVKHNNLANGDRIYLEADAKVEFMAVTSAAGGSAGAYTYSVTRNLDGSGANQWYAGDAVLDTGTTGNGFIDLYSVRGVKASSEVGPTIVGNVRNSSTYNDWSPRWAIGNLNGLYGYSGSAYGVAMGDSAATNITIDATNGIRIRSGTTNKLTADTSGNLSIVGDLSVGTSGVIRSNATAFGTGTGYWLDYNGGTPRFRVGTTAGNRLSWDGTDLTIVSGNLTVDANGIYIAPATSPEAARSYAYTVSNGVARLEGYDTGIRAVQLNSTWTGGGSSISAYAQLIASSNVSGADPASIAVRSGVTGAAGPDGNSILATTDRFELAPAGASTTLFVTGGQLQFPASQFASSDANTLDDYEEGSWTPVIGGVTSESGQSYSTNVGRYVKVGKMVTASTYVKLSTKGTITGNVAIKGLPFTIENTTALPAASIGFWENLTTNVVWVGAFGRNNTSYAEVMIATAAQGTAASAVTGDLSDTTGLIFTITYRTD